MTAKRIHSHLIRCLLATALLSSSGCATVIKGKIAQVDMDSKPPTTVYINGEYAGKTPLNVQLASNQTYTIEFKRKGYETKQYRLGNHVGLGWVFLDCFLFYGLIVDFVTGAWYVLDEYNVTVELEKEKTRFPKRTPQKQPPE
jgi:hypothetical protein